MRTHSSTSTKAKFTSFSVLGVLVAVAVIASVCVYDQMLPNISDLVSSTARRVLNLPPESQPSVNLMWLMAYPHAGAEEVMDIVEHGSQRSMATNYGELVQTKDFERHYRIYKSEPLDKKYFKNGPYKNNIDYPLHEETVLVKTFCSGHCLYDADKCKRFDYVRNAMTVKRWLHSCVKPRGYDPSRIKQQAGTKRYHDGDVKKAIIMYRNPLAMVVDRFKSFQKRNQGDGISFSTRGLHDWCDMVDIKRRRTKEIKRRINSHAIKLSGLDVRNKVPCYSEFFRILKWYDNAIAVSEEHLEETLMMSYEMLRESLEESVEDIFDFIGIVGQGTETIFTGDMQDDDLFTDEDKENIKLFLEIIGEASSKSYETLFKGYIEK